MSREIVLRATTVFNRARKSLDTLRAESALNTQFTAKSLNSAHTNKREREEEEKVLVIEVFKRHKTEKAGRHNMIDSALNSISLRPLLGVSRDGLSKFICSLIPPQA
ncbi:hypothetical protein QCA50_016395 [Cerrena zonata]|uniref:Uncharacterized protein n=1 Tax=Cerrena zonata TaxID=2478898 RepID=A0AAW0FSU6_9APHY